MARPRTISDERLLAVAREAFRERGHAVPAREIARRAGVSEGVLYQRFASKDALFFAAMAPARPDLAAIFGAAGEEGEPRRWLQVVTARMSAYFETIVPLAIEVIQAVLQRRVQSEAGPPDEEEGISASLERELTLRLRRLQRAGQVAAGASPPAVARLLVSLAHDRALSRAVFREDDASRVRGLAACVDAAWAGIAPGPRR